MEQYSVIADQFVNFYYNQNNSKAASLINSYSDDAILHHDGKFYVGLSEIKAALQSEKFSKCKYMPILVNTQPSIYSSILICVQGILVMDPDNPQEVPFVETFFITQNPETNACFIKNHFFAIESDD